MTILEVINSFLGIICVTSLISSACRYVYPQRIDANLSNTDAFYISCIPAVSSLVILGAIQEHFFRIIFLGFYWIIEHIYLSIERIRLKHHMYTFRIELRHSVKLYIIFGIFLVILFIIAMAIGCLISYFDKFYMQNRINKVRNRQFQQTLINLDSLNIMETLINIYSLNILGNQNDIIKNQQALLDEIDEIDKHCKNNSLTTKQILHLQNLIYDKICKFY